MSAPLFHSIVNRSLRQMRFLKLGTSLSWKIGGFFMVVAAATAIFSTLLFWFAWNRYDLTAKQWVNWDVADAFAREFRPFIRDSFDNDSVQDISTRLTRLNPFATIYLLDARGGIVFSSKSVEVPSVRLAPIEKFLAHQGVPLKPVVGDDPESANEETSIFSAATVTIAGVPGYIYVVLGTSQTKVRTFGLSTPEGRMSFLFFSVMAAVCWLSGMLLFNVVTRWFHSGTEVVREFAAGNYSRRIPIHFANELSTHSETFNRMADTIERNIEELQRIDSLRGELVANVSHDLRTPIALMQANLEYLLMKADTIDQAAYSDHLDHAKKGCDSLRQLIGDLHELSELNAKGFSAKLESTNVEQLAREVVSLLGTAAEEKGIDLQCQIPSDLPEVRADSGMLKRALVNLLGNAIRYTQSKGQVRLSIETEQAAVCIRVSDNGPGISHEDLGQIFDRFYRTQAGRDMSGEGSGLGLAIVKRVVELQGSELRVESVVGEGSEFWFSLPTE